MLIVGGNQSATGGYTVDNSLLLDRASGAKITNTFGSTTNRRTFTVSLWTKKTNTTQEQNLVFAGDLSGSNPFFDFRFNSDQTVNWYQSDSSGSGAEFNLITNRKFTDPNAWYHIVMAVDTTQGTSSNRVKLYVNGVQQTSLSTATYPSQNFDTAFNLINFESQYGGLRTSTPTYDGYICEVVLIDGQQLDPTSFGEFDEDSGVWKPISVSGLTFGDNGYYLDFEDSSDLGQDVSGNNNDFTLTNISSTDQFTDTCTNNFCTLNPLRSIGGNIGSYSEGNTKYTAAHNDWQGTVGSIGSTAGKWYWEYKLLGGAYHINGIVSDISNADAAVHDAAVVVGGYGGYIDNGQFQARYQESAISGWDTSSVGVSFTTNDIVNIALDMDNKFLYFGKNGTWMKSGNPASGATGTGGIDIGTPYDTAGLFAIPALSIYQNAAIGSINFGNPSFAISSGNADGDGYGNFEYAVPSGYFSWNTKNLAEYG